MDSEGITRAWTMVPVISRKANATHTQEISSRITRLRSDPESGVMAVGLFDGGRFVVWNVLVGVAGRMFAGLFGSVAHDWERTAPVDFELQSFGRIDAGVAGRAKT